MLRIRRSTQFKKDYKRCAARGLDLDALMSVIGQLANGIALAPELRDHFLSGNYRGKRECHIAPDWLLIYELRGIEGELVLVRTGTHSDLFD